MTVFRCIPRKALLLLLAAAVSSGCSTAPPKPETIAHGDYAYAKQYLSWLIGQEMRQHDITGLSIALVDDQRVIWMQGFGYADKAHNVAAGADTVYRLGSISKLFTATAVMQLAAQGRVDIDHPLAEYLPGFSIKTRFAGAAPITPRHLMTHHSGLPSDRLKGMFSRRPDDFNALLPTLAAEYAAYPPNYVFSYSNVGVSLLGAMVAKVSGKEFSAYADDALLRPMGMTDASFTALPPQNPRMSKAYKDGKEIEEVGLRDVPAGGLNASAKDMSRFMAMIFAGGTSNGQQILPASALAEMLRPQNEAVPLDLNFHIGLGWMLGGLGEIDIPGVGTVAHHAGATMNFTSQLIVLPEKKLGVIVLANSNGSTQSVNHIATEAIRAALETKTGMRPPAARVETARCDAKASAEMLAAFPGYYATMAGLVRVRADGEELRARIGGTDLRLASCDDGQMRLRYRLLGLIPIDLGEIGRVGLSRARIADREVGIARTGEQKMLVGEKIAAVDLPAALRRYLGDYEFADPGDDAVLVRRVKLRYDDGLLIADATSTVPVETTVSYALTPISDSEAIVAGLGRSMGETMRFATIAGVEHLYFAGLDLRHRPSE